MTLTLLGLVSTVTAFTSFGLGLAVLVIDRRRAINRVFAAFCFLITLYSLAEARFHQAPTLEAANAMLNVLNCWPIPAAVLYHFVMILSGRLKGWGVRRLGLLYGSAVVFAAIALFTDWLALEPVETSLGWTFAYASQGPAVYARYIWMATIAVAAAGILFRYYRLAKDRDRRAQAKFGFMAVAGTLVLLGITQWLLPAIQPGWVRSISLEYLVGAGLMAWAIGRYGVANLTPAMAADDIVRTVPDAIMLVGPEGRISWANPAAQVMLGYPDGGLVGRGVSETCQDCAGMKEGPNAGTYETYWVRQDGSRVPVAMSIGLMHDRRGRLTASVFVARDLTRRLKKEAKFRELYAGEKELRGKLEDEMSRRVLFTRALVHELKTPVTSLIACAEMLRDTVQTEDEKSLVDNLERASHSLNKRIDELLDLARGEVGMLTVQAEAFDPHRLLSEIAAEMGPMARDRKQTFIVELPATLPTVLADAVRIRQAVVNLVGNAVKYTPEGGAVTLRAFRHENGLAVEVKDSGPGISESEQAHLFELYNRGKDEKGRSPRGLGMGLALTKMLVELHGGQVAVRSQPGAGSTFGFWIPLRGPEVNPSPG